MNWGRQDYSSITVEDQRPSAMCLTYKAKEPPHEGEFVIAALLILLALMLLCKFGNTPKRRMK